MSGPSCIRYKYFNEFGQLMLISNYERLPKLLVFTPNSTSGMGLIEVKVRKISVGVLCRCSSWWEADFWWLIIPDRSIKWGGSHCIHQYWWSWIHHCRFSMFNSSRWPSDLTLREHVMYPNFSILPLMDGLDQQDYHVDSNMAAGTPKKNPYRNYP